MVSQEQLLSTAKPDVVSGEDFILSALSTDLQSWALFLDIDGTLLDLAETPDAITVPPSLPADLDALSKKLDGALALVTGRSLDYADQLFSLSHFPIAGLHGAERRDPDGQLHKATATAEFERLKADLVADTASWAGVFIEDKGAAVAAHYRLAPDRKDDVELVMERALIRAGPNWTVQQGKMVIEIRPASADKARQYRPSWPSPPLQADARLRSGMMSPTKRCFARPTVSEAIRYASDHTCLRAKRSVPPALPRRCAASSPPWPPDCLST